jgi:hypothetical protein
MDFVEPFGFWVRLFLFNGFYFIEPNGFKKIDIHSDPIGVEGNRSGVEMKARCQRRSYPEKGRMRNRNKMRMNRERDGMSEKNLLTPTGASAQVGGGDEGCELEQELELEQEQVLEIEIEIEIEIELELELEIEQN